MFTTETRETSSPPNSLLAVPDAVEGSGDPIAAVIDMRFDVAQTAVGFYMGNGGGDDVSIPDAELRA